MLKCSFLFFIFCFLFPNAFGGENLADGKYRNIELKDDGILTQVELNIPNTRYVIKATLDLDNKSIKVPDNCIIAFEGGMLKNGEIKGSFVVEAANVQIFDSLICRKLLNRLIPIEWYGGKSYETLSECKRGKDSSVAIDLALKSVYKHGELLFSSGYYRIENTITIDRNYRFKGTGSKNDYSIDVDPNIGSRLVFTGVGKPMFIIANDFVSFDSFNFYHGTSNDQTDCFHFSDEARSLELKNSILYCWRYGIYKEWNGTIRTGLNRCIFEKVKFSTCIGGVYMNQTIQGKEMFYCTGNFFDNCAFEHCLFGAYLVSNSNIAMVEFNRCNFYKIGWGKYNSMLYAKFGCAGLRFHCGNASNQSSHVLIKGCYFEDIIPHKVDGGFDKNSEMKIGNIIYPINDRYYSCIISENNSCVVDGCSFTNCPKYFSGDKYCSWDIRENRIWGYNMKIPVYWHNKKLLYIWGNNNVEKKKKIKSAVLYSNVLSNNNVMLNGLVDFEFPEDKDKYNILNCFEETFVDFPPQNKK